MHPTFHMLQHYTVFAIVYGGDMGWRTWIKIFFLPQAMCQPSLSPANHWQSELMPHWRLFHRSTAEVFFIISAALPTCTSNRKDRQAWKKWLRKISFLERQGATWQNTVIKYSRCSKIDLYDRCILLSLSKATIARITGLSAVNVYKKTCPSSL